MPLPYQPQFPVSRFQYHVQLGFNVSEGHGRIKQNVFGFVSLGIGDANDISARIGFLAAEGKAWIAILQIATSGDRLPRMNDFLKSS